MPDLPLVSVITPCYNGEAYLDRYFESILRQTYPNIELIFVNDGSTDRTEELALSYRDRLEARGIRYLYIAQENTGVSGAVNTGLQHFRGDYLTWPDSDDWMTPDCIAKKVAYLEAHPEKGLVQCRSAVVDEHAPETVIGYMYRHNTSNGWIFDDYLFGVDTVTACGSWLVRSDAFRETHPSGQIVDEYNAGQNYQMLLPTLYRYECGFLPDVLYFIVVREESHSHRDKDYASKRKRSCAFQSILRRILTELDMPEETRQAYFERLDLSYAKRRLQLAMRYHQKDELKKEYALLREKKACSKTDTFRYLRGVCPPVDAICTPVLGLWMRLRHGK